MFKLLMVSLSLIKALSNGLWLMEPDAALSFRPLVEKIISGESFEYKGWKDEDNNNGPKYRHEAMAVYANGNVINPQFQKLHQASPGSIAIIPLLDVVMQEDFCGSPGLKTLRNWMAEADANKNIIGQILHTNSPGGNAWGVDEFSQFITTLKKPVVTWVDGSACSAAYWIPSATNEIVAASKHAILGSIGAFSTFYDYTKARELRGVREIQVYAPQSGRKNKIFRDMTSTDAKLSQAGQDEYANRFLKPLVDDFINAVNTNRKATAGKMTDAVLQGDIFNGTEAINLGLADYIGDLSFTINRVKALAKN